MVNSPLPWDAYFTLMSYIVIALDNWQWVRPVGIGEMILWEIYKIFQRATGYQANNTCITCIYSQDSRLAYRGKI